MVIAKKSDNIVEMPEIRNATLSGEEETAMDEATGGQKKKHRHLPPACCALQRRGVGGFVCLWASAYTRFVFVAF